MRLPVGGRRLAGAAVSPRRHLLYGLDGAGEPVPLEIAAEADVAGWGAVFADPNRVVAQDTVAGRVLSTVFLGIDYGFGSGPQQLYETAVFGSRQEVSVLRRWATRAEAAEGHARILAEMVERLGP